MKAQRGHWGPFSSSLLFRPSCIMRLAKPLAALTSWPLSFFSKLNKVKPHPLEILHQSFFFFHGRQR